MNFKIRTVLVMVASFSTAAIGATSYETFERRTPSFGVQAGVNFESAKTPAQISSDTQTGFLAGVTMNIPLTATLEIVPELNYSRRSISLVEVGNLSAEVNQHSIEVPVVVKAVFGEKVRPYVFLGPMAVINISNEVKGGGASLSYDPETVDLSAVMGVGLEISQFSLKGRYSLGLTETNRNGGNWKSRGFALLAGLSF